MSSNLTLITYLFLFALAAGQLGTTFDFRLPMDSFSFFPPNYFVFSQSLVRGFKRSLVAIRLMQARAMDVLDRRNI